MSSSSDSVSLRSGARHSRKLCEGWLGHKTTTVSGTRYDRLWILLENNILYIFKNNETSKDTQLGSLTIDNHTVFKSEAGGDQVKGFKFDLTTGTKKNRFKSKKSSERELWRGYIMGVASGKVPDDLDLLEDQVTLIRENITSFHTGQPVGKSGNRVSMISGGSGDSGVGEINSIRSGFSRPSASGSGSGSGGSGGGPTMKNKFYNEMSPDQVTPSWFFSGCSREKAVDILTRCSNYGNTLMRESTSHMKSGSYVISKRSLDKTTNTYVVDHFEVMRVAGGYKLNVQNEHQPMRCLTDVMEYFKETSGSSTHFMDTNDPYRIGLASDPEYQRHIRMSVPDPEPWAWPPPDYEDPIEQDPAPQARYQGVGASTVSPGILRNAKGPGPRKSVEFHPRNTFAGSSQRVAPQTTFDDIVHRSHVAAHLREFDDMIDGFDTSNIYQNDDPMNNPESNGTSNGSLSRNSMPLPPTPHQYAKQSGHSYVNEGQDPTLESLPVAPPPPRASTIGTLTNGNTGEDFPLGTGPSAFGLGPFSGVQRTMSISSSYDMRDPVKMSSSNEDVLDHPSIVQSLPVAPQPPVQSSGTHAQLQNEVVDIVYRRESYPETTVDTTSVPPPPPPPPPPPVQNHKLPPPPGQTSMPVPPPGQTTLSPVGRVSSPVQHQVAKVSTPSKPASKPAPKTAPKPAPKPEPSNSASIGKASTLSRAKSSVEGNSRNTKLHQTQSSPASSFEQNIADKRAHLKKTNSEAPGLVNRINPKSPESMPTWDTKPLKSPVGSPSVPNTVPNTQFNNTVKPAQEVSTSGIDESNPGGVRNLSSMFEQSAQVSPSVVKTQRSGGGRMAYMNPNRKSAPVFSLITGSEQIDGQSSDGYLHPASFTNSYDNAPAGSRDTNTSRHSTNIAASGKGSPRGYFTNTNESYDLYDDTAIPGALAAGQHTPVDKTEKTKTTGLNDSFKRKLEGVIGGVQPTPNMPNQRNADHVYEELPLIPPDAVTYANDFVDE